MAYEQNQRSFSQVISIVEYIHIFLMMLSNIVVFASLIMLPIYGLKVGLNIIRNNDLNNIECRNDIIMMLLVMIEMILAIIFLKSMGSI